MSLKSRGLVQGYPNDRINVQPYPVARGCRYTDIIRAIELTQSWVYDSPSKSFIRATATHSMDTPDAFGRPTNLTDRAPLSARSICQVSFQFRTTAAGLSQTDLTLGHVLTSFKAAVPEGLRSSWSSTTERSYFVGIQNTANSSLNATVNTELKTVSAGLQFTGLCARLPGNMCRMDAQLEISSFDGQGYDKNTVNLPVQIDGPRGKWIRTVSIRGGDASVDLLLKKWHATADITGSAVELLVRVD